MDAVDDRDIYLQRSSANILSELESSLPKLLFINSSRDGAPRLRKGVRASSTQELINLLEPFQESPQLLDPRLHALTTPLVNGFLLSVFDVSDRQSSSDNVKQGVVMPTRRAICKLLYTLCKIRGPKTIQRFLSNEANVLEPMLNKFHRMTRVDTRDSSDGLHVSLAWEEKYIFMLWLSHLLLTPFDLDSIGSFTSPDDDDLVPAAIKLPKAIPSIASRLTGISAKNLAAPGKEREAAVKVLVRLSLRPDMLRIGLYEHLIRWAVSSLESDLRAEAETFPWDAIGYLSFLAAVVSASDAHTLEPYLSYIFQHLQSFTAATSPEPKAVISSAVARKAIIKIYRAISIAVIQLSNSPSPLSNNTDNILEEVIDHLLTALADKDTPVRYAASKAISTIATKLETSLRADVIDAVLGSLGENVLEVKGEKYEEILCHGEMAKSNQEKDLNSVDPLRWHGLVLTLAQLVFQRSPTPSQLPPILNALILALNFEQRSSSGTSIGTNVRDAACFGIWSIARRYSTKELSEVTPTAVAASSEYYFEKGTSVLQLLATELTCAAALDPSGNIRRGSSAALQELVGRHPDTIVEGINLVQIVDYHAVALRYRALKEVAVSAAKLHPSYWSALLSRMLRWRGVAAVDAASRRQAAQATGLLSEVRGLDGISLSGKIVHVALFSGDKRSIERRHGLLLAGTSLVEAFKNTEKCSLEHEVVAVLSSFWTVLGPGSLINDTDLKLAQLRPELTAEAVCSLVSALAQVSSGPNAKLDRPHPEVLERCIKIVEFGLFRREELVIDRAAEAAKNLFELLSIHGKELLVTQWIDRLGLKLHSSGTISASLGHLAALGAVYVTIADGELQVRILDSLLACVKRDSNTEIETKIAAIRSLRESILPYKRTTITISEALAEALQDYTTDQRGDIGSLVRLEALYASRAISQGLGFDDYPATEIKTLVALVCTLAAEKLDKVRFHAWKSIMDAWDLLGLEDDVSQRNFPEVRDVCSVEYYSILLSLFRVEWLRLPLLQGLATSVGSGSESVLRVSRTALSIWLRDASNVDVRTLADCALTLLTKSMDHERLVVPTLETWAFLLQTNCMSQLEGSDFNWRHLFNQIQKSHYRSSNPKKLSAAVEAYSGLASISSSIRKDVLKKLTTLLLHPLPRVRNAAADSLFLCTQDQGMRRVNWSRAPKELKGDVERVRGSIGVV